MRILIFRKGDNRPSITATIIAQVVAILTHKVRVQRPSLASKDGVGFFLPAKGKKVSDFYRLPIVPSKVLNNPAALLLDGPDGPMAGKGKTWADLCGYEVPADSLGKAATADRSQANSLRLWISQNLPAVVAEEDVAVILVNG
jgi:hypothetical protein